MKVKQWFITYSFFISLVIIISGFVIMAIPSEGVANGNSFHQLTLAPILLLTGYSLIIFAIMNKKY